MARLSPPSSLMAIGNSFLFLSFSLMALPLTPSPLNGQAISGENFVAAFLTNCQDFLLLLKIPPNSYLKIRQIKSVLCLGDCVRHAHPHDGRGRHSAHHTGRPRHGPRGLCHVHLQPALHVEDIASAVKCSAVGRVHHKRNAKNTLISSVLEVLTHYI